MFNLYFGETKYGLKTRGPTLHEGRREVGKAAKQSKKNTTEEIYEIQAEFCKGAGPS